MYTAVVADSAEPLEGCPFGVCAAAILNVGIVGDGRDGIVPFTGPPVPFKAA